MTCINKISIVIPFYNRIHLLEKTIQSVLHQDSSNWELILVDDGSTEEVDELKAKYSSEKIRFFKRSRYPKGAPTCRNIGAENTSFDHIMFLDSDDIVAPWCITERTKVLLNNPNGKLYIFEALEFDESNPSKHRLRTIRSSKDPLKHFLDFQSVWQTSCMVWKKDIFKSIGGWKESVESWQDGEIAIRYLLKHKEVVWGSRMPDVFIRKHGDTNRISNQFNIVKIDNLFNTYYETLEIIDNQKLKLTFKGNIENMLFTLVEGNVDYSELKQWFRERFSKEPYFNSLMKYLKLYELFSKNRLFYRTLYQLRKLGIPNKRKLFWSIRPQLEELILKKVNEKIKNNKLLEDEIKIL